ncbi:NADH-quinone oxidoreductase subunit N [Microbispora cellulosiformans]|uniref:NADH-quinone oxidoreductase subunit N n=1 Tax=Microbispora cellulosiformans TaxID=2614688 RepID=A0A5J5JVC1_9ACTN|nr:NADH-quinone oxidoreductase subunit N [Microbispora cellulosiformans]KAA9375501.1 NADH-quinone oxidoreductase subunit N [Microbispora cellulosiformans]
MNENPLDLLPEVCVLLGAVAGLVTGLFLRRDRQRVVAWICGAALVAGLAATLAASRDHDGMAFMAYRLDGPTNVARGVVLASALIVLLLLTGWARGHRREAEAYVLVMLAALGSIALAGADDLLVLVAAYLLASIPAYTLAGFAKDAPGAEAALKYYLMSAFLGVLMLAGVTLLYGLSGATAYQAIGGGLDGAPAPAVGAAMVLLLAGPLFKAGSVPAHFWVPDVTEGAPPAVAAFVTTVPKIGAFVALVRLATEIFPGSSGAGWSTLVAILATATMTLGNLAAFYQDKVRRLLAYSTISQAGYLLVPLAVAGPTGLGRMAVLFYVAAYAVTNLGAFAVVVATGGESLGDYAGLARRAPWTALALIVCLLGLVGTPPAAVFAGKLLVFTAAWDGGYGWLAVVAVVNTVASVFYYLRWILPVFRADSPAAAAKPLRGPAVVACVVAAMSVVLGLAGGLVLARL